MTEEDKGKPEAFAGRAGTIALVLAMIAGIVIRGGASTGWPYAVLAY